MEDSARIFEEHRRLLEGIAYRMLGTLADAQDVVQDTWLKWSRADTSAISEPRAWLVTVCSRLALDVMKSARRQRETYYGTWLPEPFLDEHAMSPAERHHIDDTVSMALMLALEKLSPAERATFLLHEVFGYRFEEIAGILGKSVAACRKLSSRARTAVRTTNPRFEATPGEHQRLLDAFFKAAYAGDAGKLKSLLAESVELHADGGGKVDTVAQVLHGADTVSAFFARVLHPRRDQMRIVTRWFNGVPGVLVYENGQLVTALSLAIEAGAIHRIFALRNPDKLEAFHEYGPA